MQLQDKQDESPTRVYTQIGPVYNAHHGKALFSQALRRALTRIQILTRAMTTAAAPLASPPSSLSTSAPLARTAALYLAGTRSPALCFWISPLINCSCSCDISELPLPKLWPQFPASWDPLLYRSSNLLNRSVVHITFDALCQLKKNVVGLSKRR